ncbi:DNA-processing protein DprA [Zhaonella formicivorans]|uniref:DNA-processing protein DprA n=1 Tax=Zhaonella formicivorans TaxID=2528593 RepID=UPI0010D2A592|nr:DNA-processing protein DprA [Zhaonella formicivorans]
MQKNAYWNALNSVPGIGPQTIQKLIEFFGNPENVWHAEPSLLESVLGSRRNVFENFLSFRAKFNVEAEWEKILKKDIKIVTFNDKIYPVNLRYIYGAPQVLYYKGSLENAIQNAIAIVGSRKATAYGQKMAEKIAYDLGKQGFCVVSGMARGIDSFAHWGVLRAAGSTIAVLGNGLDIVYPPENKRLMEEIIAHGAVISEFPLGTKPEAQNFPRRNRLISGLTLGVVVVEAAEKSGSLITADYALEQGRDVFAVPGPVFSRFSKGTNYLIKQGAKLVEDVNDILEEYGYAPVPERKTTRQELSAVEAKIVELLSWEPVSFEEIMAKLLVPPENLLSTLTVLEIRGIIKQLPGQRYIIA